MAPDSDDPTLPTLAEFLAASMLARMPYGHRANVREPGFSRLYVRYRHNQHTPGGIGIVDHVLDLAAVEVTHPGQGTFTAFYQRVMATYPRLSLYAENVHNERFRGWLERMGFQPTQAPLCYLMQRAP